MNKYNFTPNEHLACLHLVDDCVSAICANRPIQLEDNPFTWCHVSVLRDAGWTREQAAGTYGSLAEKGAITLFSIEQIDNEDPLNWQDYISHDLYKWAEGHWDDFIAKGKPRKNTLSN